MKKKRKNLPKPLKNYVILGLICGVTILAVIYLCLWYRQYRAYQDTIPTLRGVIPEITERELGHYVQESDRALLYLCVPANDMCRNFEKDLKTMILKKELKDELTYLNLENETHAEVILKNLHDEYHMNQDLLGYPAFLLFENGEVYKVLQGNDYTDLSLSEVEQFLDTYITD